MPATPGSRPIPLTVRFAALLLAAGAAGFAQSGGPAEPAAPPPLAPPRAPDEVVIEKLIDDLESADPAVRAAASRQLEQVGPEVIPVLQKYVDGISPEVVGRVKAAIASYKWMSLGAIILEVEPGSPGDEIGLRAGDAIVKADDFDIDHHDELTVARGNVQRACTLYVWRDGRVLTFAAPAGRLGFRCSNWDIALGGADQSRGLAAFAGHKANNGVIIPDYDEAYRRLHEARAAGMTDPMCLSLLAALAARKLEAEEADEAYKAYRAALPIQCGISHGVTDGELTPVPLNSPHTRWLLARYRGEPFSTALYHELEDWFVRNGRNGPMARELLEKPWPQQSDELSELFYHDRSRMLAWLQDRRFDDVLTVWNDRSKIPGLPPQEDLTRLALQAALRKGDASAAVQLGIDWLREPGPAFEEAFWPFALAAAEGDDAACDRYLAALAEYRPNAIERSLDSGSASALLLTPAARRFRAYQFDPARPRPDKPGRGDAIAMASLVTDPAATRADFDRFLGRGDLAQAHENFRFAALTGMLRFGDYDTAAKAAQAIAAPWRNPRELVAAAAEFGNRHAERLAGRWKGLRGFVQVVPGRDAGTTWVLRYDNALFLADERSADEPQQFGGLPAEPPSPLSAAFPHLRVTGAGVAVVYPFGRPVTPTDNQLLPSIVYVLDTAKRRFVPAPEFDGAIDLTMEPGQTRDTLLTLAARAAARGRPPLPGGAPRECRFRPPFVSFEGDILVHVDDQTLAVTDLSAEIGRLAGRDRPAHVWRNEDVPPPADGKVGLIYSDCGLWRFEPGAADPSARLTRVTLGLGDENVIVSPMPTYLYGPRQNDESLVGVAPQQGGQVFRVNPMKRTVVPTKGYCGLGPPDWFAERQNWWQHNDPQPFLYAGYLARLAKAP